MAPLGPYVFTTVSRIPAKDAKFPTVLEWYLGHRTSLSMACIPRRLIRCDGLGGRISNFMTTIACDGLSIAGDGQGTAGSVAVITNAQKVFRVSDGRIAGLCGDAARFNEMIHFLETGERPEGDLKDTTSALILHPDGTLERCEDFCSPFPGDAPAAMGSGSEIALGVMLAGGNAVSAVTIAATRDIYTGGSITVMSRVEI